MKDLMGKKNLFFIISAVIIITGIIATLFGGLNQDIDFSGGTAMHINIGKQFDNNEVRAIVKEKLGFEASSIQKAGDVGQQVIIKIKEIDTAQRIALFDGIKEKYSLNQEDLYSTDNVNPTIGNELKWQALIATLIASVLMLVYISFRFEFKSGVAAVVALIHDLFVMLAVYALFRIPINTSFIAAMLTILGYSINDTIIVFDRIRENNRKAKRGSFDEVINTSVRQTMARTINTSLTTLLTIGALYFLGVPSIKEFALPLIIGIISGTYSSIFIASPIWSLLREWSAKSKTKHKMA